ncbi:MAG: hypothetical protein IPL73_21080 [Candidatus Obscuribacter sp.]|nr:hypothetical protein [Candidatus Obscuribacter sp.]
MNNTVAVSFADNTQIFTLQPDGSYTAPGEFPSELTLTFGLYKLTMPNACEYNFNSDGQIANWVSPDGVTITYTYSGGDLSTISNGMGRTLTLGYTSGKVTSVTDGTGRSIGYAFDVDGNLEAFTDAVLEDIVYEYVEAGLMSKFYMPANPAIPYVFNVYDSLNRVQSQEDALGNLTTLYIAGARAEVEDPVGNKKVYYFNRTGYPIRAIDALGNETKTVYDGLDRKIEETMPEGNQLLLSKVSTAEDGNGNTTTYTYDGTTGGLLTIQRPMIGMSTPTVTMTYNARGRC